MIGNNKKIKGFTLVEILMVVALFAILTTVIVNVFILTLNSQRQASARQKTLANLRFVIEKIARQVRTSEIDYHKYTGLNNKVDALFLIDSFGSEISYSLDDNGKIKVSLTKEEDGLNVTEESYLTDNEEVKIVNLDFYIDPTTNPFQDERCRENTDCYSYTQDPNQTCLVTKICQDGEKKGYECNDDSQCPESICVPPPFESGFCSCGDDSECLTNHCSDGVCLPINYQPKVTIALAFQSQSVKVSEQKIIFLQTTVSSRVYKR